MKISTKGRYGLRMMTAIARRGNLVSIREIVEDEGITVKYAEQIISILVKGGLVKSVRGAQGGYGLVKRPQDYSVAEILKVTEGDIAPVDCVTDNSSCDRYSSCSSAKLWKGLYDVINNYLSSVSLADILQSEVGGDDYCI